MRLETLDRLLTPVERAGNTRWAERYYRSHPGTSIIQVYIHSHMPGHIPATQPHNQGLTLGPLLATINYPGHPTRHHLRDYLRDYPRDYPWTIHGTIRGPFSPLSPSWGVNGQGSAYHRSMGRVEFCVLYTTAHQTGLEPFQRHTSGEPEPDSRSNPGPLVAIQACNQPRVPSRFPSRT